MNTFEVDGITYDTIPTIGYSEVCERDSRTYVGRLYIDNANRTVAEAKDGARHQRLGEFDSYSTAITALARWGEE